MRHKIRAGGKSGTRPAPSTPKPSDDLMVGRTSNPYTSKELRYTLVTVALIVDMVLHIAVGVAVWYSFEHSPEPPWNPIMSGVLAAIAASFLHRTFIQRLIRTTLGKLLFGLRLRREDGSYPTLGQLIEQWFIGIFGALEILTVFS
ncbi:RDD family protein [Nocardia sp. NPDC003345]